MGGIRHTTVMLGLEFDISEKFSILDRVEHNVQHPREQARVARGPRYSVCLPYSADKGNNGCEHFRGNKKHKLVTGPWYKST